MAENYLLASSAAVSSSATPQLATIDHEITTMVGAVLESVVSVTTYANQNEVIRDRAGFLTEQYTPETGQGSGAFITFQGHILTNAHVVAEQTKFCVRLSDGRIFKARLIGEPDKILDIAILKLDLPEGETLPRIRPLKFANSDDVRVGQTAWAIGAPLGLGDTVTQGIISAKNRAIMDNESDLLQTDAAINQGNSGGPLVNRRGELMGVNVAIATSIKAKKETLGIGIGFAIPSNEAKASAIQILDRGKPLRGHLGIAVSQIQIEENGSITSGVQVAEIKPFSAASKMGIQAGDLIRSYNGKKLKLTSSLVNLIRRTLPGQRVEMHILREGENMLLKGIAADSERPEKDIELNAYSHSEEKIIPRSIGITLQKQRSNWFRKVNELEITKITPGSRADLAGIKPQDIIIALDHSPIETVANYESFMAKANQDDTLSITVERQKVEMTFML